MSTTTTTTEPRLCQHGNPHAICPVSCGVTYCRHACGEHVAYEPEEDEVVDEARCWEIRRECLEPGCDCAVFLDPTTEEQATGFGRSFGEDLAREFIEHPEWRGEAFTWNGFPVGRMAVTQWGLTARYGFDDAVVAAAEAAWRRIVLEREVG